MTATTGMPATPNTTRPPTPSEKKQASTTRLAEANAEIRRLSELITARDGSIKNKDNEITELKEIIGTQNSRLVESKRAEIKLRKVAVATITNAVVKESTQEQVYQPTKLYLKHYREDHEEAFEDLNQLDNEINTLRNDCKKFETSLSGEKTLDLSALKDFDSQYEKLETSFFDQRDKIKQLIKDLPTHIKNAEHTPFSQEQKNAFSAMHNYPLSRLNQEEEEFRRETTLCKAALLKLNTDYTNTVTRFKDTVKHLHNADCSIHRSEKGELAYRTGKAASKLRSFDENKVLPQAVVEVVTAPVEEKQ